MITYKKTNEKKIRNGIQSKYKDTLH